MEHLYRKHLVTTQKDVEISSKTTKDLNKINSVKSQEDLVSLLIEIMQELSRTITKIIKESKK